MQSWRVVVESRRDDREQAAEHRGRSLRRCMWEVGQEAQGRGQVARVVFYEMNQSFPPLHIQHWAQRTAARTALRLRGQQVQGNRRRACLLTTFSTWRKRGRGRERGVGRGRKLSFLVLLPLFGLARPLTLVFARH